MKKYILPLLFGFQAIILSLCLVGFTFLKKPLLQLDPQKRKPIAGCAVIPYENPALVGLNESQLAVIEKGEKLFLANCTTCHLKGRKASGPNLDDICNKYPSEADKEWLFSWIRNSADLIFNKKDPRAIALWESNNKYAMNAFPSLTDEEIIAILEYLQPGCVSNQDK
ncbi:MAG: cytochrome c [Bacteroidota bacterium]